MRPDDLVWIHDYQLILLPAMLRERRPDARIGFFLHIPFPPAETFRILPQREVLLTGLLGADVVAFQTYEHLSAFRRALLQVLGRRQPHGPGRGRRARDRGSRPARSASPRPTGSGPSAGPGSEARIEELRASYAGRHAACSRWTGSTTRRASPSACGPSAGSSREHPELRGKVMLVQVAVPSREGIPRYAALRREVNELVGEINGELGTADWNPVVVHPARR